MHFALLGPLALHDETGSAVPPPSPRPRIVLAALLLNANLPVSMDALADAVWDGRPPAAAAETLRSHVMRLRRALGPVAGAQLVASDPGYLLHVGDDDLDVLAFERLHREAVAASRAGSWQDASDIAARALALWRAEPLLDVPSQVLRDMHGPRLEQIRDSLLEDRVEADLRLGRHATLIPELRDLTRRFPLRERLHEHLVTALAHGGDQAEALAAYQAARRVLIDELGIEPGPRLRDLQDRLLSGDRQLLGATDRSAPEAPAAVAGPGPAPRGLPALTRHLVGRQTHLDALAGLVDEAERSGGEMFVATIDGMPGAGKTALAVAAAHRLAGRFPDGQLFLDLRGHTPDQPPRTVSDALDALLSALGVPSAGRPRDLESRAVLYRQRIADTRTLIVLDNASDEAQVRPLLPGSGGSAVLVTSRRRLRGLDDAHPFTVDVLAPDDSATLLRAVAGPDRVAVTPGLTALAALCGHLPLAVRMAGALLRHRPAWTAEYLSGLLGDETRRTALLADGERDLDVLFDLSYRAMDEAHRSMFRHLGLVPGPDFDASAAAALTGTDPAAAAWLLEGIVDHHLLIQHLPGRYRLHDLVRLFAGRAAREDTGIDGDEAVGRLAEYYGEAADRADALIDLYPRPRAAFRPPTSPAGVPRPDQALTWLRAEYDNIVALLEHGTVSLRPERGVLLAGGLATLLRIDGRWQQAIGTHAAAVDAARRTGDALAEAQALLNLGDAKAGLDDRESAERDYAAALELYRAEESRLGEAAALALLGETRRMAADREGAAGLLAEALDLFRLVGERRGEATVLALLGELRRAGADYRGAADALGRAADIFRSLGDRRGTAVVQSWLGYLRGLMGDYEGAERDLREAAAGHRALGERSGQIGALVRLGALLVRTGAGDAADRTLRQALDLCRVSGDSAVRAEIRGLMLDAERLRAAREHRGASLRVGIANGTQRVHGVSTVEGGPGAGPRREVGQNALHLARPATRRAVGSFAIEGLDDFGGLEGLDDVDDGDGSDGARGSAGPEGTGPAPDIHRPGSRTHDVHSSACLLAGCA